MLRKAPRNRARRILRPRINDDNLINFACEAAETPGKICFCIAHNQAGRDLDIPAHFSAS